MDFSQINRTEEGYGEAWFIPEEVRAGNRQIIYRSDIDDNSSGLVTTGAMAYTTMNPDYIYNPELVLDQGDANSSYLLIPYSNWWRTAWNYRVCFNISSSAVLHNLPVIFEINLTSLLLDMGETGCILPESLRLLECDASCSALYEVAMDFKMLGGYHCRHNAVGDLMFVLNGTTSSARYFCLYFDTEEHGPKPVLSNTTLNITRYHDSLEVETKDYTINLTVGGGVKTCTAVSYTHLTLPTN